ncbi:hypothetical protein IRJ41_005462 [Triplophysa rosa]|uniref:Uncharacterized protein n=1 Tax=Triplophysa rosa TaxID=992332 RepID=A0A9W7THC8_TRIRA|nr:hypothetical protein IRJ41_005462 [Triplophysa rosa]
MGQTGLSDPAIIAVGQTLLSDPAIVAMESSAFGQQDRMKFPIVNMCGPGGDVSVATLVDKEPSYVPTTPEPEDLPVFLTQPAEEEQQPSAVTEESINEEQDGSSESPSESPAHCEEADSAEKPSIILDKVNEKRLQMGTGNTTRTLPNIPTNRDH